MHRATLYSLILIGCAAAAGCGPNGKALAARTAADSVRADSIARAQQDSLNRTMPGYVVDSILPIPEALRRFRATVPGDSATSFAGGSASRDALVRRFVAALVANDTSDLRTMAIHGREFADLYYPESRLSHPPYQQPPVLAWQLLQDQSTTGLTKLIHRLGGKPMTLLSVACDPKVDQEGRNTRYVGCLVRVVGEQGDTATKRYFGSIVARDGQYKFLSYANDF